MGARRAILLTVAALLMSPVSGWGQACAPVPAGIVSWWPGEGSAADITPTGNNGVLNGSVTFVPGEVNLAFNFEGAGFVRITNNTSLQPADQIAIEGWIRPLFAGRPTRPADTDTFLSKVPVNEVRGYGLFVTMDPTPNTFFQAPPAGVPLGTAAFFLVAGGIGNQIFSGAPLPNDGLYHHVAGTSDGTTMRLFVDGVEATLPRTVSGPITHATEFDAFIGGDDNVPMVIRYSRAAIDEISLYASGLSSADIQAIVAAGSAGKCPL